MRSLLCALALALGLPACLAIPASGQQSGEPRLETIREAYRQLDYATAADSARAALDVYQHYTPTELVEIYTILGLIEYSQNRPREARGQFISALNLDPNLELDSLLVSPKILTFFNEVQAEMKRARPEETGNTASVRYVIVEDKRSEAALRSMVLPGWGQLHKGDRTKGRVLLGLWGATAVGSMAAHLLREQARKDYEAAATSAEALDRYGSFNRWHKTRNALLLGAAGIWIYGYMDALISEKAPRARSRLLVAPAFSNRQPQVVLRLQF